MADHGDRLRVVSVLRTGKYGPRDVEALYRQVKATTDCEFVCYADTDVVADRVVPLRHRWPGWWAKLEAFREPGCLYLDLGTRVFTDLSRFRRERFTMIPDFYKWGSASGMMWIADDLPYRSFDPIPTMRQYAICNGMPWGDGGYLMTFPHDIYPRDGIYSWKIHCRAGVPEDAALVFFHGQPDCHHADLLTWSRVTEQADTVAIIGGGPSLAGFDLERLKGKAFTIGINKSAELLPWVDCAFTLDTLELRKRFHRVGCKKYAAVPSDYGDPEAEYECDRVRPPSGFHYLRRFDTDELRTDPGEIGTGNNSGFGAFNLALHMKPKKIVLFGIDLTEDRKAEHWYGENHYIKDDRARAAAAFNRAEVDCEVIVASRHSAITRFPRVTPEEGLACL